MKKIFNLFIFMALLASCANNSSSSASNTSEPANSSAVSSSLDSSSSGSSSSQAGSTSQNSESSEGSSLQDGSSSQDGGSSESSSSENGSTSEDGGSSENNSSEDGGSSADSGSSSSSETEEEVLRDIADIKAVAATFDKSKVNNRGVYTSTIKAEITAQLLTLHDYKTTKQGYNGQYKAFVANESGFITINIPEKDDDYGDGYETIVKHKEKQQVYKFSGVIGLYNDEVEIDMGSIAPLRQVGVSLDYDYKTFATPEQSIDKLRTTLFKNDFKLNVKGVGWKQAIYKMDLEYVSEVVEETALFSDGVNVIEVHGPGTVNDGLTVGKTYTVYGRPGLYNFRPELDFIGIAPSAKDIALSYENIPQITAAQIFNYGFEIEKDTDYLLAKNKVYGGIVNNVYYFEGYVNHYAKDGKLHLLLEDSYREKPLSSETSAYTAKALSIKNEDSRRLTDRSFEFSPFYDFYHSGEKFGVYLTPHEFSKLAWDVFVLTEPFAVE